MTSGQSRATSNGERSFKTPESQAPVCWVTVITWANGLLSLLLELLEGALQLILEVHGALVDPLYQLVV